MIVRIQLAVLALEPTTPKTVILSRDSNSLVLPLIDVDNNSQFSLDRYLKHLIKQNVEINEDWVDFMLVDADLPLNPLLKGLLILTYVCLVPHEMKTNLHWLDTQSHSSPLLQKCLSKI